MRGLFACLLSVAALAATAAPLSPSSAGPPAVSARARKLIQQGDRLYMQGRPQEAAASYQAAVRDSPAALEAWLDGGVVWSELGNDAKGAAWFRKAAELAPEDAAVGTALGEAELREGRLDAARAELDRVLSFRPEEPYALIAKGKVDLAQKRAGAAISAFESAARGAPKLTLAYYWLAKARQAKGDIPGTISAYKKAAFGDSYFIEARRQLALTLLKAARPREAWEQIQRLLSAESSNPEFLRLADAVRPQLSRTSQPKQPPRPWALARELLPMAPPRGQVPMLRVGLGTSAMGKPLPHKGILFFCSTPFSIAEARSGKVLARGAPGENWQVYAAPGKRIRIEARGPRGRILLRTPKTIVIRPLVDRGGIATMRDLTPYGSSPVVDHQVRGQVELSLYPGRAALQLVNIVDLETYTHGVLAAEMPIESPLEALKAQAVVARTHALYIKTISRRHKKDGYDLCDGQHCQVYAGVRIESGRSRAVVDASRGRVVTYQGKIAHVLYASNCGGHTQSGSEVQGWGNVPYWKGIADSPEAAPLPSSPWLLRQWLRLDPPAYCGPSAYVHPSHFRWTRAVRASELEARLNRALKIGRLKGIVGLRRSASGHLNSVLVRGSRRSRVISSELRIRGLLGVGSQRSSLFVIDTDFAGGVPTLFTFYGGGWGHGVGMCQSGAMGRSERGQSYVDILKAYYPGTELGDLRY